MSKLIALCGLPGSGKDEVASILNEMWGVEKIDDGACLRDFAQRHLGLSHWETHTQDGKRCYSEINGTEYQNRDILGSLGRRLEEMFGEHIMPWIATQKLAPHKTYCFPSCRKTQGYFYKQQGGIVVEVRRPGLAASPYDFDWFDPDAVDLIVHNTAMSLDWRAHLRREVVRKLMAYVDHGGFDVVS